MDREPGKIPADVAADATADKPRETFAIHLKKVEANRAGLKKRTGGRQTLIDARRARRFADVLQGFEYRELDLVVLPRHPIHPMMPLLPYVHAV